MRIVGIDLSGPVNTPDTAIATFEADKRQVHCASLVLGATDSEILESVRAVPGGAQLAVGIDAPLSYNPGGGNRPGDRALRAKLTAAGLPSGAVMTPTANRMVYLTLRGVVLARALHAERTEARIVEVHPGGALALSGAPVPAVARFKREAVARAELFNWLESQGLAGLPSRAISDHELAACAGALATWRWLCGEPSWCRAADPPLHPFDFVC